MLPATPHFEQSGLAFFLGRIRQSSCYLEYGCGGSTLLAARSESKPAIISVDSDPDWAERISLECAKEGATTHIQHCDVGQVGSWGTPIDTRHYMKFPGYMATPWNIARELGLFPDTVLIDGRFRVASFLFSLINAQPGCVIIFDDYFNRPEYSVVEKYCTVKSAYGRMAEFLVESHPISPALVESIACYSVNSD
jgi:hypothetical protein